jgi:G3E family GTPase
MLMRVLLISGFLGSGKTSALLKLCAYLVKRENRSGTSVMIIENEIGDVGVDDKVIKMQGLSVKELFAGCACCTSGGDLLTEIRDIRESIDPSWLIIEATGLAYPLQIKKMVSDCFKLEVKILSLADAARWKRLRSYMPDLIDAQLADADCILLNKVDLVDVKTSDDIVTDLRSFNSKARIHKVTANKEIDDSVWGFLFKDGESL